MKLPFYIYKLVWVIYLPSFVLSSGIETLIGITGKDFVLLASDASLSTGSVAIVGRNVDKITRISPTTVIAASGDPADTDRLALALAAASRRKEYEARPHIQRFDCRTGEMMGDRASQRSGGMSIDHLADTARDAIIRRMRTRAPYQVSLLVAGLTNSKGTTDDTSTSNKSLQHQIQMSTQHISNLQVQQDQDAGIVLVEVENEGDNEVTAKPEKDHSTTCSPVLYWLDAYGAMKRVPYGVHGHASTLLWSLLDQGWRPDMSRDDAVALMKSCLGLLEKRYIISSNDFCVKCLHAEGCDRIDVAPKQ